MDDLLTLVPEHWQPYVLLFFLSASFGSALLKLVLGDPKPGDSMLRRLAFGLAQGLDWAAINSETVRAKFRRMRADLAARDEAEIAEAQRQAERGTTLTAAIDQHNMMTLLQEAEANAMARLEAGVPPDVVESERFRREMAIRAMTPERRRIERAELAALASKVGTGLRAIAFLALLSLPTQACAGSQLRTHASIADAVSEPLLAAKHVIEARMDADAQAVRARAVSPEDEHAQMLALQASYAGVEASFELVRQSYNSYVEAIQAAHETGADIPHELALALLSRWRAFVDVAQQLGIRVPEPPEALSDLGGVP